MIITLNNSSTPQKKTFQRTFNNFWGPMKQRRIFFPFIGSLWKKKKTSKMNWRIHRNPKQILFRNEKSSFGKKKILRQTSRTRIYRRRILFCLGILRLELGKLLKRKLIREFLIKKQFKHFFPLTYKKKVFKNTCSKFVKMFKNTFFF